MNGGPQSLLTKRKPDSPLDPDGTGGDAPVVNKVVKKVKPDVGGEGANLENPGTVTGGGDAKPPANLTWWG